MGPAKLQWPQHGCGTGRGGEGRGGEGRGGDGIVWQFYEESLRRSQASHEHRTTVMRSGQQLGVIVSLSCS